VLAVTSIAAIRYIATNEDSGEEMFEDCEGDFNQTGMLREFR
jgi:hypothetical protein